MAAKTVKKATRPAYKAPAKAPEETRGKRTGPQKEFDNTNRGVLFENDRKTAENHPDFKGKINVDGTDYWLSAWKKIGKNSGQEFLSLSVQPMDAR